MSSILSLVPQCKNLAISALGAALLWMIRKTLTVKRIGLDGDELHWPEQAPRIVALWHSHQLMMPWVYLDAPRGAGKRRPFTALISKSPDGRLIARAMKYLGVSSVTGSSTNGGREAMYSLAKVIKAGSHVVITPDGPKGPPQKIKQGVLRLSQLSGATISPAAIAGRCLWKFGSWDRMILPKPFSTIVIAMGRPISIHRSATKEEIENFSDQLESALNDLGIQAQESLGEVRGAVAPA